MLVSVVLASTRSLRRYCTKRRLSRSVAVVVVVVVPGIVSIGKLTFGRCDLFAASTGLIRVQSSIVPKASICELLIQRFALSLKPCMPQAKRKSRQPYAHNPFLL